MYSRAGLVALVLAFSITSIAAAPVPTSNTAPSPTSLSNSTPRSHVLDAHVSLDITQQHAANIVLPSRPIAGGPLAARELVSLDRRRRNPFSKIKKAFKKVGKGFKKIVHFVKANAAKIAKVGLKIASTVTTMASKFVKYIPGVGTALSQAMSRAGSAADSASDHIHANIGGKLGKAMAGMDKAEKIAGYIPREFPEDVQLPKRDLEEVELDARTRCVRFRGRVTCQSVS